jgi:hypothetical protein
MSNNNTNTYARKRTDKVILSTRLYEYFLFSGEGGRHVSINSYYKSHEEKFAPFFSRQTMHRMWKKSGLKVLFDNLPNQVSRLNERQRVIDLLSPYIDFLKEDGDYNTIPNKLSQEEITRIQNLHKNQRFLTDTEEEFIVSVCCKFSDFGYPITRKGVSDLIDSCIKKKMDNFSVISNTDVSKCFVNKFIQRHKNIAQLIKASSLDPQRADQINENVRDALFAKLDIYTKLLRAMNVLGDDVQSFGDIHPSQVYNVDEVAFDSTKRVRSKVLGRSNNSNKKKNKDANWKRTFEGDGKMYRHATIVLCSRADGE